MRRYGIHLANGCMFAVVSACVPSDLPLSTLFLPGSIYGPPCLVHIAGYEITGKLLAAETSQPVPDSTLTLRLIPRDPLRPLHRRVVLTDESGAFKSSAYSWGVCSFPLEPTPLVDPPEEIELEIMTNEGVVIVTVSVGPEMVSPLSDSHGLIELPPVSIIVAAEEK